MFLKVYYKNIYIFYILNKNTKLVYLKSAKLEQIIVYLMQFNCVEVVLKSNLRFTEVYVIVLKWNYCKYTSGTL